MSKLRNRSALVLGLSTAVVGMAATDAHADVAVNISGPTLTITATDGGDGPPRVELTSAAGNDYEIRYNSNIGMTVTEDSDRCTAGGTAVSEVQCERDDLTDVVFNADPTEDTDFAAPFTDDDDVLFNGGAGDDLLDAGVDGMANDDVINGGDGNDDLEAGDGVDQVNGGAASDDIDAGEGGTVGSPEVIDAGAGNDTDVHGGEGVDSVSGGDGTDVLEGEEDADTLNGGIGADTLRGEAGNDTLNGDAGNDTLDGGQNPVAPQDSDTLNGGADNDTLRNSPGPDAFNGGASTGSGDEVDYSVTAGSAAITADIDAVAGDDGPSCPGVSCEGDSINADVERLTGDDGPDTLTGSSDPAIANTLSGAAGADSLAGGTSGAADGADTFNGGAATDLVTYASRTGDIDADIGGVADTDGDLVGSDVENLTGGAGDDDLTGDDDANVLAGGAGDDELEGNASGAADLADVFTGGSDGTAGGQNGANGDIASYASRTVAVDATIGNGANDGSGGCPAGAGCEDDNVGTSIENLTGGSGEDLLIGDELANRLLGGGDDDELRGGAGVDADGADTFDGGAQGTQGDTVSYANRGDGVVAIIGVGTFGGENDVISANVDNIDGTTAPDNLGGDADANRLDGRAGDDVLIGDFGNTGPDAADILEGGGDGAAGDTVSYAPRDDDVTASIGGAGGSEGDSIDAGVENLVGGDGDDSLFGDTDLNRLDGAGGDDVLAGGQGSGPDGADVFIGGADGTAGGQHTALKDLVTYSNRADGVSANLATGAGPEGDVLDPTLERLTGGSGADTLTGDAEANRIEGGGGDDTIAGGATATNDGRDILVGGANGIGGDTASYAARTDALAVDIGGGANDGAGGCPAALGCEDDDVQGSFENLIGGSGADTLTGTGTANVLTGGLGADNLSALAGPDRVEARDGVVDTIDCGTEANDTAVTDSDPPDVQTGCETVDAGVFTPPAPPPPPPPPTPPPPAGGEEGGGDDSQGPVPPAGGGEGAGDILAPQTTITDAPARKTRSKRARFEFDASETASFRCKLDSGRLRSCSSPRRLKGLDPGRHTFAVVATDAAGNVDPSPATFAWKVKRPRSR